MYFIFLGFLCIGNSFIFSRISKSELQYIKSNLKEGGTSDLSQRPKVPWIAMAKSLPVWGIIVVGGGNMWGLSLMLNQFPAYLSNVLGISIAKVNTSTYCHYILLNSITLISASCELI